MKLVFQTLCIALFLVSCQKTLSPEHEITTATVASDANSPFKSHKISFVTDYPVKAGEVPPFTFTKTQYPDARIRTIYMLSRKNPIYPGFKKEAYELNGTFTYAAAPVGRPDGPAPDWRHYAFLKGTWDLYEYYKTASGAGSRRLVSRQKINYRIVLNEFYHALIVGNLDDLTPDGAPRDVLRLFYWKGKLDRISASAEYFAKQDQYGDILDFDFFYSTPDSYYRMTYDYSAPTGSKNYSYAPTQNLVSKEYTLMEVMQWLPQPSHARKTIGSSFRMPNGPWVTQDRTYKNYKFDADGNQTSVTYEDGVLQKTTWHVQR